MAAVWATARRELDDRQNLTVWGWVFLGVTHFGVTHFGVTRTSTGKIMRRELWKLDG